ncbi:hypothetical protein JCM10295v2_006262 [Rhodotorula toruloides]
MLLSAITALAALAGTALAQSSSGIASAAPSASTAAIPTCAVTCLGTALPNSPYGVSNITCICTSQQFQLAYFQCQQSSCSQTDLQAAEQYGAKVCQQNGTPIDVSATPSGYSTSSSAISSLCAPLQPLEIRLTFPILPLVLTASGASASATSGSSSMAASSGSMMASSASKPASTSVAGASGSAASGSSPSSTSAPKSGAHKTSGLAGGVVGAVAAIIGVVVLA